MHLIMRSVVPTVLRQATIALATTWSLAAAAATPALLVVPAAPKLSAGMPVSCFVEAGATFCPATTLKYAHDNGTAGALSMWVNGKLLSCTNSVASSIAIGWLQKRRVYTFRLYRNVLPCNQIDRSVEPAIAGALTTLQLAPIERPRPGVGGNIFSLVSVYMGWSPTESAPIADLDRAELKLRLVRDALDDAGRTGLSFVRFPSLGFGPETHVAAEAGLATKLGLAGFWYSQRGLYWSKVQSVFDDLHTRNLRAVPSVNWTIDQFVLLANNDSIRGTGALETTRDLLTRPASRSYGLMRTYLRELALGYTDAQGSFVGGRRHPAMHYYEIGNELNLQADLNRASRCAAVYAYEDDVSPYCSHVREFSTAEMIRFHTNAALELKKVDPYHLVTSGNSIPRPNAEHLRACPEWVAPATCAAPRWTNDSETAFARNLIETNEPFDSMSIHYYARDDGSQNRFCTTDCANLLSADFLDKVAVIAASANKSVAVGEFSDFNLAGRQAAGASFSENVLARIAARSIPYAAVWTWEDPFFSSRVNYPMMWSIARTPASVAQLRAANAALGFTPPATPAANADFTAPKLTLAWPRDGELIERTELIHAVAADDSLQPPDVEAFLNGVSLGIDTTRGYRWSVSPEDLTIVGSNMLTLRACDQAIVPNCTSQSIALTRPLDAELAALEPVSIASITAPNPVIDYGAYGTANCRGTGAQWYWYCIELTGTGFAADAEVIILSSDGHRIGRLASAPIGNADGTQTIRFYLPDASRAVLHRLFDAEGLSFTVRNPGQPGHGAESNVYTF